MIGTDTWYPPPSESQLGFSDLAVDDSFYDKLLGYGKVQKKSPTVNLFNLDGMSCVSATAVLCVLLDIIISISCILREHCRLYGQSATSSAGPYFSVQPARSGQEISLLPAKLLPANACAGACNKWLTALVLA